MTEEVASFWVSEATANELSPKEKELRNKFVEEYLFDYDAHKAALRLGFSASFAAPYADRFMTEPYVVKRISERQAQLAEDEETEEDFDRRRIRAALLKEAHYYGRGSSHAARVSALAKLAAIRDMDAPTKIKTDVNLRGGVMMIPQIAGTEDWEKAAMASQGALQQDANLA